MPIIYCYHFLILQPPRFASGFKTRWWWIISLPLAQHVTWKPLHTLYFLHGTYLRTSSMRRGREEAHSGVQHPQPGQGYTAPRHPAKHHSQASSCWKIQWKRAWERGKDARHHLSSWAELWYNRDMFVGLGSCLDPIALGDSQHNSRPPPSPSPVDLIHSPGDRAMKMFSMENINLQVILVLSTAFIQCSYFVVRRKALHLFSCFMQEWPKENSKISVTF